MKLINQLIDWTRNFDGEHYSGSQGFFNQISQDGQQRSSCIGQHTISRGQILLG